MAYSDFTLEKAGHLLGVISRAADLFPNLQPVAAPAWLVEMLASLGVILAIVAACCGTT